MHCANKQALHIHTCMHEHICAHTHAWMFCASVCMRICVHPYGFCKFTHAHVSIDLYMCACVCMHAHACGICTFTHARRDVCVFTCATHARRLHLYACVCTCTHGCLQTCLHVCACMCVGVYVGVCLSVLHICAHACVFPDPRHARRVSRSLHAPFHPHCEMSCPHPASLMLTVRPLPHDP